MVEYKTFHFPSFVLTKHYNSICIFEKKNEVFSKI